ncbi:hypothetical protein ACFLZ7_04290 [Nanoarchaeota archaeon]
MKNKIILLFAVLLVCSAIVNADVCVVQGFVLKNGVPANDENVKIMDSNGGWNYEKTYTSPLGDGWYDVAISCDQGTSIVKGIAWDNSYYGEAEATSDVTTWMNISLIKEVTKSDIGSEESDEERKRSYGYIPISVFELEEDEIVEEVIEIDYRKFFIFEDMVYIISIQSILNESANILILPDGRLVSLELKETKKIDLNDDKVYDLSIRLTNLEKESAEISIRRIKEMIPGPVKESPQQILKPTETDMFNFLIMVVILGVIAMLILFYRRKKEE